MAGLRAFRRESTGETTPVQPNALKFIVVDLPQPKQAISQGSLAFRVPLLGIQPTADRTESSFAVSARPDSQLRTVLRNLLHTGTDCIENSFQHGDASLPLTQSTAISSPSRVYSSMSLPRLNWRNLGFARSNEMPSGITSPGPLLFRAFGY